MKRAIYLLLVWLHPPAFRREYAGEMLWIFDQTAPKAGTSLLFKDVVVSLLRQWLIRSRLWIFLVAATGALFTMLAGNSMLHFLFSRIVRRQASSPQEVLLFAAVLALLTVIFTVIVFVNTAFRVRRRRA